MTAEIFAARIDAPTSVHRVPSRDGTTLAVYEAGRGDRDLVLCPGLGGNLLCWKNILEGFQAVYRMITWDPRGTYGSGIPNHPNHIGVPNHVDDLEDILEALGVQDCVLAGWSMGVQVAISYLHRHPERMPRALVLINGHPGILFRDFLNLPVLEPVVEGVLRGLIPLSECLQPVLGPILRSPPLPPLLQRLGMVAPNMGVFPEVLDAFSHLHFPLYLRMLHRLGCHSTEDWLGEIRCPTLITAGSRDLLTPASVAQRTRDRIPGSRLVIFEDGTHYAMMEMPDQVHRALEDFLREVDPQAFAPRVPEPPPHRFRRRSAKRPQAPAPSRSDARS